MEEMLLSNSFNVGKQGTGETDFSIFVQGLIDVVDLDRVIEFHSGEGVFSHKLPVNAGDVCTTVDKSSGVNNF